MALKELMRVSSGGQSGTSAKAAPPAPLDGCRCARSSVAGGLRAGRATWTCLRHYSLGSVLTHVMLHQTVIGQEVLGQLKEAGGAAGSHRLRVCRRRIEPGPHLSLAPAPESTHAVRQLLSTPRGPPRERSSLSGCPATASWTCRRTARTSDQPPPGHRASSAAVGSSWAVLLL